ncbi:MAG: hypothetical protein Q9190_004940 [Brigantiaea leucoxantha]
MAKNKKKGKGKSPVHSEEEQGEDNDSQMSIGDIGFDGSKVDLNLPEFDGPLPTLPAQKEYYAEKSLESLVKKFFMHPDHENQLKIRKANEDLKKIAKEHGSSEFVGEIPLYTYLPHLQQVVPVIKALRENREDKTAWNRWGKFKKNIRLANENRGLPPKWGFPAEFLQKKAGVKDRTILPDSDAEHTEGSTQESTEDGEESDSSDGGSDDDDIENLMKDVSKKYKRQCGRIGYQCIVKSDHQLKNGKTASSYRLLPGSEVGTWKRDKEKDVMRKQLGNKKDDEGKYLYKRDHLTAIKWVAWQPKHRKAVDTIDPRNWSTIKGAPQVYVGVEWKKDGKAEMSIETRTTIRRILGNKSQGGPDYVIFERARRQEEKCFGKQGDKVAQRISSDGRKFSFLNQEAQTKASQYNRSGDNTYKDDSHSSEERSGSAAKSNKASSRSYKSRPYKDNHHSDQEELLIAPKKRQSENASKQRKSKSRTDDSALGSDIGTSKATSRSGKSSSRVQFEGDISDRVT